MKTGRELRGAVGVAVVIGGLLIGLLAAADTVDHLFSLISEFDPATAEGLVSAMYLLDDDLSDVAGDVEALRASFKENPREFLRNQGVNLPADEYSVTGLDIGALRDLPNAFHDSPLAEGMTALPYTICWQSHNTIILLQLAAREPMLDESGNVVPYATVAGDTPATQEYLRAVVNTPDLLLLGMLRILVQVTRDDGLRAQAVETGLRSFAGNEDMLFETDRFGLQIINLDPADGPKPELGVHFSISEGSQPSAPEGIGFIFIPREGAAYAVVVSHTF